MFKKYIDFKYFIVAFSIGLLYIYISNDYKKTIIVYPTPQTTQDRIYKDKAGNCFKYVMKPEDNCPTGKGKYINVDVAY